MGMGRKRKGGSGRERLAMARNIEFGLNGLGGKGEGSG